MINKHAGKLRGMYTDFEMSVDLDKSLATGEKRYVPKIGRKRLRLSWKTHTRAEIYGNAVLARYKKKIELQNEQIREGKEK